MPRDPELFDELAYLEANPDVRGAVLRGNVASGLAHWNRYGRAEGRPLSLESDWQPSANVPAAWNERGYLRANPDVAAAVRARSVGSGYEHWVRSGERELRPGGLSSFEKADPQEVLARHPRGLNCFGFHSPPIGLAAAARGYVELLREMGAQLAVTDAKWDLADFAVRSESSDLSPYAVNLVQLSPTALPAMFHRYGSQMFRDRLNIGVWIWELHAGYPEWHAMSRIFHEIWVPAEFVASAFRPVSEVPLVTIPYVVQGFDSGPSLTRSGLGWPAAAFVFLYVFDMASTVERKNPLALISAFRNAFGDRSDVLLVLKYQHADHEAAASALMERLAAPAPNIRIMPATLSERDLHSLFQLADCFVSPHCSEGFGLNIATAMYYGKPTIATGYSGNMQFTTPKNCFLIDYEMTALEYDAGPYRKGYAWACPSIEHLEKLLREVVESPEEARTKAVQGQADVRAQLSKAAVSRLLRERLAAIGIQF